MRDSPMPGLFSQASGIIMSIACGRDRPEATMSSRTALKDAESEAPGGTIGKRRSRLESVSGTGEASRSEARCASRARIQLRLPRTVLISPLWAIVPNGWASCHDGNVFVENREWTSAMREVTRSSLSSV
ncbi:hypothetical protein GCM10009713_09180 [Brevibacterium celere]